jgi:DNA-binding transcriptional MocR family regulator
MSIANDRRITGSTAADIVGRVRDLVAAGELTAGETLPPIRELAQELGVNRNTVAAAYRLLVSTGAAEARGRAGTAIAGVPVLAREGAASPARVLNLASGNPDPALLPDAQSVLARLGYVPTLYGTPGVDAELGDWARRSLGAELEREFRIVLAHGAVDAVERLLTAHLSRGDGVAVEDPCFLSSIGTLRLNGYRTHPVAVDEHGMTPDALAAAIDEGARAVILTPRAHNPTGASLSARRAAELRAVLERHPHILVIEDDHFSAISAEPYRRATPATTNRWALVRSVSKFLGPDLRLAFVAADPDTAARLETRLNSGTNWVSHLLQRLVLELLSGERAEADLARARDAYAARAAALVAALAERGIPVAGRPDGLNVWIEFDRPSERLVAAMGERGWQLRSGEPFASEDRRHRNAVRVTTAALAEASAPAFAEDLADAATGLGLAARRPN